MCIRDSLNVTPFYGQAPINGSDGNIEWAVSWSNDSEGFIESFCNTVPTPLGGTHEVGLRNALTKGLRGYGALINNKQAAKISAEDVVGSASIVLSVFIEDPQFQGQTKEKLTSPEVAKQIETTISDYFDHWLSGDPNTANILLDEVIDRCLNRMQKRSEKNLKILDIIVEEQPTGEISAGAGIGTNGGSFAFNISENNWLGRGINLQSALNLSQAKVSGNISIINPNYNFTGNEVSTSVKVSSTDRSTDSGFKSSRTGFNIGTSFEQYENIFLSPNFSTTWEDVEVDSTASSNIKKMEGNFFNMDFGYGVSLDKRNQRFQTSDGYRSRFNQSIPLVTEDTAFFNSYEFTTFHQIADMVARLSIQGSAITAIQIDGVLHEFSSIKGVREDVTDIVLNVKNLAVKLNSSGSKKLILDATGPKEVKARDITPVNGVETVSYTHLTLPTKA